MAIHGHSIDVRQFIVENVDNHPNDIARHVAKAFGITPQAARNQLSAMVKDGTLEATGKTRARRYTLKPLAKVEYSLDPRLTAEHIVWRERVLPHLSGVRKNVIDILGLGVTEMINNVRDHSESPVMRLGVLRTPTLVNITINDEGVGVFRKVREAFNLVDERTAILELSKGKLTTAPTEHSGYGIFFTSRMVDIFQMGSGKLYFTHSQDRGDWLIGTVEEMSGTFVSMTVATDNENTPKSVYDRFCGDPNSDSDFGFHKTHVPLQLAQFGNESLVSRSQAKVVLSRFDRFTEVMLDFNGVEMVGQSFIDEIFRVFKLQHPEVSIVAINANRLVQQLIRLAQQGAPPHQKTLPFENMD